MATNKELLRIFPLLWNWRFYFFPWLSTGAFSPSFLSLVYNILGVYLSGHPFHPSIPSSIHPSSSSQKKKMMEEEEEGGGRMAATSFYPNVYVIQYVFNGACSWACWWWGAWAAASDDSHRCWPFPGTKKSPLRNTNDTSKLIPHCSGFDLFCFILFFDDFVGSILEREYFVTNSFFKNLI